MIKGLLIDVNTGIVKVYEFDNSLDEYYKILNCNCIDITCRLVGNKFFRFVVDDLGAVKKDPIPSFIDLKKDIALLYGNLFIVSNDVFNGELQSLTDEDIEYLMDYVIPVRYKKEDRMIYILAN